MNSKKKIDITKFKKPKEFKPLSDAEKRYLTELIMSDNSVKDNNIIIGPLRANLDYGPCKCFGRI